MKRFDWYFYSKILQRVLQDRDFSFLTLFGFPDRFKGMQVVYDREDHKYEIRNQLFDAYVVRSYMRYMTDMPEYPIVFDLGASYGIIASAFLHLMPGAQITLFEPNPNAFSYIKHYLTVNGITNIVTNNAAVGAQDGSLTLYINPDVWESANVYRSYSKDMEAFDVRCVQLSSYLRMHNIPHIDFLKMDIEGAEWDVLSDLEDTGWLSKISNIAMELHCCTDSPEQEPEKLITILEAAGHTVKLRKTGSDKYQQRYLFWSHRA